MRDPVLVESPTFFPGMCVDGRQDGPVADTFYEPPGYGRVYLSRAMVRDCARLFPGLVNELAEEGGFVPGHVHDAVVTQIRDQLDAARGDVADLERMTVNAVRRTLREDPQPAPEPEPAPAEEPGPAKRRRPRPAGRSS